MQEKHKSSTIGHNGSRRPFAEEVATARRQQVWLGNVLLDVSQTTGATSRG